MEDVNKRRRNFLSLSKREHGPKKSTPGKFAYIRHFQRIGINATKPFEKTLIHFESEVLAAVAVIDAKAPWSVVLRYSVENFFNVFQLISNFFSYTTTVTQKTVKKRHQSSKNWRMEAEQTSPRFICQ